MQPRVRYNHQVQKIVHQFNNDTTPPEGSGSQTPQGTGHKPAYPNDSLFDKIAVAVMKENSELNDEIAATKKKHSELQIELLSLIHI